MKGLTHRQSAIVDFIRDRLRVEGRAPSIREIGRRFQIRSPHGVVCHLRAIEAKNVIVCGPTMPRAITILESP